MLSSELQSLFSLEGKTSLVTGGGTGLGRIMTETMALAGAKVLICSRKMTNIKKTADEINEMVGSNLVLPFEGDISSEAGVEKIYKDVVDKVSKLDILINNSGATWGEKLGNFP